MASDHKFTENPASDAELNDQVAAQMLETIFDACETKPNSVPLDVLVSYANYRKERFAVQKVLIVLLLIALCAVPFLFIGPKFTLTMSEDCELYTPTYLVKVSSILPVSKVSADIDGYVVGVTQQEKDVYAIEPTTNGKLTVTVTLANHQTKTETISVTTLDLDPPVLVDNYKRSGKIAIQVSDDGSGINYDATLAVDTDGLDVYPIAYDEEKNIIYFEFPKTSLNVYIYDNAGNKLQLVLTLK